MASKQKPRLPWLVFLSLLALAGFTANNTLGWLAANRTSTDPATYTLIRLLGGVLGAWLTSIFISRHVGPERVRMTWNLPGGIALFVYAVPFAYAYKTIGGGVGATILFVMAQIVILSVGYSHKERPTKWQWFWLAFGLSGFAFLIVTSVPTVGFEFMLMMMLAGSGWGRYVVNAKREENKETPLAAVLGSFIVASILAVVCYAVAFFVFALPISSDFNGLSCAVISGAAGSGFAYAMWYKVLVDVPYIMGGVIQLVTPILVAGILALPVVGVAPAHLQLVSGAMSLSGMAGYIVIEHWIRKQRDSYATTQTPAVR